MKFIRSALSKIRDIYEIAVPSLAFLMMFSVFIWGIFCRYVLKVSCTWANEVQIMGYLWTVLPAAVWARRRGDHVCFSMLYDSVDLVRQRVIRIAGNIFMIVFYSFLFVASVKYIANLRQRSMALEIPLKFLYLPFPIMVGGIWLYSFSELFVDVRDVILEALGKKEKLQHMKVDKAAEYLAASEKEFQELFEMSISEEADWQDKEANEK